MRANPIPETPDQTNPDSGGVAEERLLETRVQKAANLRARGIDPYPARFKPTVTSIRAVARLEAREAKLGEGAKTRSVTIAGRVMARRGMGKAAFLDIKDADGKIQVHARQDVLGADFAILDDLDIGDIVGVKGPVFRTRRGEPSVEARSFTMLTKAVRGLPDKWAGLQDIEKRFRQRELDLITNDRSMALVRTRSAIVSAIRRFMEKQDFIEVETPVMVNVAAGASAQPFQTHHNALNRDLYLRIATELHLKRLVVGGIDRVFEIGRIFRNEGIDAEHNPEFTTIESYQAYADYNDVMQMVEDLVSSVAQSVTGSMIIPSLNESEPDIDLTPPWPRLDLRTEIMNRTGIDFLNENEVESLSGAMRERGIHVEDGLPWGRLLDKVISAEVEPHLIQPVFLVDYPTEMSPLAKHKPEDDRIVERFEAFAIGTEFANAFTELNDPVEQRKRFEEQERLRQSFGDDEMDRLDEDFLVAMEHGMPPAGGLGLGIDRLSLLITGERSIREVIAFPQLRRLD